MIAFDQVQRELARRTAEETLYDLRERGARRRRA